MRLTTIFFKAPPPPPGEKEAIHTYDRKIWTPPPHHIFRSLRHSFFFCYQVWLYPKPNSNMKIPSEETWHRTPGYLENSNKTVKEILQVMKIKHASYLTSQTKTPVTILTYSQRQSNFWTQVLSCIFQYRSDPEYSCVCHFQLILLMTYSQQAHQQWSDIVSVM